MLEIERKFVLNAYPDQQLADGRLHLLSRHRIEQTYLAVTENQELRVRRWTDLTNGEQAYTHTFKQRNGRVREESEHEITQQLYEQLMRNVRLQPLIKVRTRCQLPEGLSIDIDHYEHLSLVVAEIEFPSVAEADAYRPAFWLGEDVTGSKLYSNRELWKQLQE